MPILLAFGESFLVRGRVFLISGHTGTNFGMHSIGMELANDATEWVFRNDSGRVGANRPAILYNDREERWFTNGEL